MADLPINASTQHIYLLPTTPEHPLYTVQPLASEPTYSVDFLSSPTCGIALLFGPSPRAAYLYSATSGLVSFSRPARMYNPSTLPCETYGTALLTRHLSMSLIQDTLLTPSRQLNRQPSSPSQYTK